MACRNSNYEMHICRTTNKTDLTFVLSVYQPRTQSRKVFLPLTFRVHCKREVEYLRFIIHTSQRNSWILSDFYTSQISELHAHNNYRGIPTGARTISFAVHKGGSLGKCLSICTTIATTYLDLTHKVAGGLIPAAVYPDNYLIPPENYRQLRLKRAEDFRTTNIVDRSARGTTRCYAV